MVRTPTGKHPNYFEAILQLRNISSEILDFVENQITKEGITVAKVQKVTNGYDYYLSDNAFTKALGKKLQQQFGGQILLTSSLHTKKDDKELHRGTVLFRLAPFQKGDNVEYQGEQYTITGVGKEILLQQSKTGKKARIKWRDMKEIKKT